MGIMNLVRNDEDFYKMDWTASKDPDAKRLSRGEQDHMVRLYGVTIMLDDAIRSGKYSERMKKIPYGFRKLRTAETMVRHVIEDIIHTTPEEQAEHMQNNLSVTHYLTYIGSNSPIGAQNMRGRYMSYSELNLMASICREQCIHCMLEDPGEMRQCPVNRIMRLMPIDNNADGKRSCGWLEVLGSLG